MTNANDVGMLPADHFASMFLESTGTEGARLGELVRKKGRTRWQALAYVEATAQQIATAAGTGAYFSTLCAACGTCLFRLSCPTYRALLRTPLDVQDAAPRSLEGVASQREYLSAVAKAAEGRKRELDAVLRKALDDQGELVASGRRYYIRNTARRTYPVKSPFAAQEAELRRLLNKLPIARLSIDQSGIGMNMAENLAREFPQVVPETFTNARKEAVDFKILLQRHRPKLVC